MSRAGSPPDKVAKARALIAEGMGVQEAAAAAGIGKDVLYRAMKPKKRGGLTPPVPTEPEDGGDAFDADADPLVVMRALLRRNAKNLAKLSPDSPRINPMQAESRSLAKAINSLEKERASVETPEQAEARLRRQDGEVRREIERYVAKAETDARKPRPGAPHGVCVKCGQPLTEGT